MYELVIKNARILDGTGAPWYRGGIAVKDGKIALVFRTPEVPAGETVVDAEDKYLAPGFIDIHSHSDGFILDCPLNESRILQGVTTEIAGNCGGSVDPVGEGAGIAELLDAVDKTKISTNIGMLVGHGTIRKRVMGESDNKASESDIAGMQAMAAQAMREGAYGMSSGLIYPPSCYSDTEELVKVTEAIAPYGGFYASHIRGEQSTVVTAVKEAIEISKRAGVPCQISHHKVTYKPDWRVTSRMTTALIAQARTRGLDVTCDQYPYRASATNLSVNIENWAHAGGYSELEKRLRDPETRKLLHDRCEATHFDRWGDIFVSYVKSEKNAWMAGMSIEAITKRLGSRDGADTLFDIVLDEHDQVNEICFGMCEDDIEHIMKQEFTMTGSDGEAKSLNAPGKPHPRNFGTFVRVLAHYCRERELFSLETAIRKMTSMPAARAGFPDRGVIREGMRADMVIFDFEALKDDPTFEQPQAACSGILKVFVNGALTAQNGVHTGARAGMALRKNAK